MRMAAMWAAVAMAAMATPGRAGSVAWTVVGSGEIVQGTWSTETPLDDATGRLTFATWEGGSESLELNMSPAGPDLFAGETSWTTGYGGLPTADGLYGVGGLIEATFAGDPNTIGSLRLVEVVARPSYRGWGLDWAGTAVPEPSGVMLLAVGLAGMAPRLRRRRPRPR